MKTFINYEILNLLPVLFLIKYKNIYNKPEINKISLKIFPKYTYCINCKYFFIDF